MNAKEIKVFLSQDINRVEQLLQRYGFHSFSYQSGNLRSALPTGDNPTSLSLYINEFLGGIVYTRGSVKGDIFTLIEEVTGDSMSDIFTVTRNMFNLPGYKVGKKLRVNVATEYCNRYSNRYVREIRDNKLHERSFLDRFVMLPHTLLIEEGISFDVAEQFNVCFDSEKERIVFPHFDWEQPDMIVGLQGRIVGVTDEEIKKLGIPKYWNYIRGYIKGQNLYGWHVAKEHVQREKKMIIFESEKSVMKHFTFNKGKGFSVALGGHELTDEQVKFIAKNTPIDCEIIIAFDKDIMKKNFNVITETCEKLSRFRKVSYIYDDIDNGIILKEKDAPIDNGFKVWSFFFNNRNLYKEKEIQVG